MDSQNFTALSVILNLALALVLIVLVLAWPGVHFGAPWDGPALATIGLTAATVVLGGFGVTVGLMAFWGYTTLREHAGNKAHEVSTDVAKRVAEDTVERLLKAWGYGPPDGEAVAEAYNKEQ
jgi:hypothetical protein